VAGVPPPPQRWIRKLLELRPSAAPKCRWAAVTAPDNPLGAAMFTDAETVDKKKDPKKVVLEIVEGAATVTVKLARGTTKSARISPDGFLRVANLS
jgi:hypothetical protein